MCDAEDVSCWYYYVEADYAEAAVVEYDVDDASVDAADAVSDCCY